MPTEAEWEYAAGGGQSKRSRFGNGEDIIDPSQANFDGSKVFRKRYFVAGENRRSPVRVGSFTPNELGLYDLSGNVSEWCSDWYGSGYYATGTAAGNISINPGGPSTGPYRVLRGGSWYYTQQFCRVACRNFYSPADRFNSVGFRLVSPLQ